MGADDWFPFSRTGRMLAGWPRTWPDSVPAEESRADWRPLVDVYEAEDVLVIVVEIPGVTSDQLRVTVKHDVLTISGDKPFACAAEGDKYQRVECQYGRFERSFVIGAGYDRERASAACRDGLLRIHIPKRDQARPHLIPVEG